MKNKAFVTILPAFFVIAFSFTSCEKEKPLNELLMGKWEVQTVTQIYSVQNDKKFEYTFYYEADELAFEFTTGGSLLVYEDGDVYTMLSYALSGNTLSFETSAGVMEWKNVTADESSLSWSQFETDIIDETTYNVEIIYTTAKVK